jgi:CheY-like chemotaxis protein
MFSQLPEHREHASGSGLGVGLALSRQLVQLHGGSIEATSEGRGRGSEFVIRLPAAAPSAESAQLSGPAAEAGRRSVLVVDDNVDAADGLGMVLQLRGHDVRVAYDGQSALREVETRRPDVMLLDIGLPGMNGYELARRVRGTPGGDGILLVAVTGWGQEEARAQTREAGFDDHLTKPVDTNQVMRLIDGGSVAPAGEH